MPDHARSGRCRIDADDDWLAVTESTDCASGEKFENSFVPLDQNDPGHFFVLTVYDLNWLAGIASWKQLWLQTRPELAT